MILASAWPLLGTLLAFALAETFFPFAGKISDSTSSIRKVEYTMCRLFRSHDWRRILYVELKNVLGILIYMVFSWDNCSEESLTPTKQRLGIYNPRDGALRVNSVDYSRQLYTRLIGRFTGSCSACLHRLN